MHRRGLAACLLLQAVLVVAPLVAGGPAHADGAGVEAVDPAIARAVDGSWRSDKARARDAFRHPAQSLAFWGLAPGMTIVEIDPGANGWWTGILAPYAKATGGRYVAALMVERGAAGADSFEAARAAFAKGVADKAIFGDPEAVDFGPGETDAIPAGSADFVLVARTFHNWARQGDATDAYLAAIFRMLKPGGVLAVEQHRAPDGADPRAGTGYVPESYVVDAARKAGFTLEARSEINANPNDTKDHPFGVWTLPPTRRSAPAGQPANPDFDHSKYDRIGESDRMTLRFRKPG